MRQGWLAGTLLALALGITAATVLGPLLAGTIAYRTSDTTMNQVVGGDLAGLTVVAPLALVAALLVARQHLAGPVIALGPAVWSV